MEHPAAVEKLSPSQPGGSTTMSRDDVLTLVLSRLLEGLPSKRAVLETRHVPAGLQALCCETTDFDLPGQSHSRAGADSR